ncbi:MerR family transcriptional regulator [Dietzia sp. PP-33]|jgi:DNA-binding transcriptional MerR regulator|uniref:MerR family transcriptional regulator n=1 Tax=Dietzia sp. PP-33 TaxID=2957500 RepID=UPI0029BB7939|nr:MerR family transcriptional regulator [Dietzia sp. PP-33]MDX2357871.1 MerR family transcriptional regulator [Dietzia sp. PP-33]
MTTSDGLTVGAVAELVGVSVRTLHHWDRIGLAPASERTWSDYRVYDDDDVARIHRVLVYRELGFPLAQIGALLDDPFVDESAHLARQRELLLARISHLQEMVSAVDRLKEAIAVNAPLTPGDRAEIFGTDWNEEWQTEAEQRWGDTPQWEQSQQRTSSMSKEDWRRVKAETDALNSDLAAARRSGVDPASPEAAALVGRHRASISEFYDCTRSMQVLLARMYRQDQRFAETYDSLEPGLTEWIIAAVEADARAHGIDPDTATWG